MKRIKQLLINTFYRRVRQYEDTHFYIYALAVLSQVRLKDSAKDSNLAHALRSLQGIA